MLTFHEYNVSLHYLFVNGVSVANVDAPISSIGPDVISFKYTAIIVRKFGVILMLGRTKILFLKFNLRWECM
ncbi:hypothetical protein DN390_08540 [Bacillus sp. SH7-1]|uniref:Uncharacterized protein n=1 Tax=Bacillus thuringiensis subsp. finitimus TaxID=29337 RepID=A0A243GQY3_BACTF|nr:hypothetical protein ATN06_15570 [Bacillus thuringiensis]OUA10513.1 hypothetical protein BK772_06905 [Bacillus thuringiensis serovar finitimus]TXS01125.1 hypothetical protein DN390_08540 [Bacillus sp. SH7-1]